jgi:hydroxylamine reductase (hybrid-cluster protein)
LKRPKKLSTWPSKLIKERKGKEVDIPDIKHKVTAGFSMEAMEDMLGAVNPDAPIKVVTDAVDSGQLRGVVLSPVATTCACLTMPVALT